LFMAAGGLLAVSDRRYRLKAKQNRDDAQQAKGATA